MVVHPVSENSLDSLQNSKRCFYSDLVLIFVLLTFKLNFVVALYWIVGLKFLA